MKIENRNIRGSRDVSPLDFFNPLQKGTPKAGGMLKLKIEESISPRSKDFRRRRGGCFKLKIEK
jgi:hypothetical protein